MSRYEITSVIIACIGITLSLIFIFLVLFDFFFKLGKQNIEQYKHYGFKLASYYFKTITFDTKGAVLLPSTEDKRISAAISIRVMNNSAYPITIDSAYMSLDRKGLKTVNYHDNLFSFKPKTLQSEENGVEVSAILDVPDKAMLPVTLNPYETKIFSLQFPHFQYYVKRYGDTVFPYLHLTTARKTYSLIVEVPEYNAIMSEHQREI